MAMNAQEKRIHKIADAVIPRLKRRKCLALSGGRWDIGYDFANTPRLVWTYSAHRKEPFAIIPAEHAIVGLGPLQFGYAEQKLRAAADHLKVAVAKPSGRARPASRRRES